MMAATFKREWAMPSGDTLSVRPIGDFVRKYLADSTVSIDPFARNNAWATYCNDIDPSTQAAHHMDAVEFLEAMRPELAAKVDLAILDPPYSPRQISELYRRIGLKVTTGDTQNAALLKRVRDALRPLLAPGAVVLSFGWNSMGMGRGFERLEYLLVAHGGAHNDTICVAERYASQTELK